MPRTGYRVRLESGLKLDINELARVGLIRPGAATGPVGIRWTSDWGEVAAGTITADMRGTDWGCLPRMSRTRPACTSCTPTQERDA